MRQIVQAALLGGAVIAMGLMMPPAASANIVLNPGFEGLVTPGTFDPWSAQEWFITDGSPHSGTYYASTGCAGNACIAHAPDPSGAWLYQELVTAPNTRYDFSFWYAPGPGQGVGDTSIELQAYWNDTQVQDIVGGNSSAYTQYTATGLLAAGATSRIEFLGRQDCCYNGLDDVSVDISAVPEPATFTLVGFGLVAGGLVRRRFSL